MIHKITKKSSDNSKKINKTQSLVISESTLYYYLE